MAGSFGRNGGSVGEWVLITNHMLFNPHRPICRYVYDLSCGRWVVGNTESHEPKGRIGAWAITGPPLVPPPDGQHCGNVSAWGAIDSVGNIILFSFSFVHITACERKLEDLNYFPNRNVENYKTTSGAGGWVEFRY